MRKLGYSYIFFSFLIASCSYLSEGKNVDYVKDPYNPNRIVTTKEAERIGKLDISLIGSKKDKELSGVAKNYFLWSACADVLSDLPPKFTDAVGGIYVTDYVKNSDGTQQSVQCRVTGDKVLSSNVYVKVFLLTSDGKPLKTYDNNELKSNVLIRARELKAQHDNSKI